MNAQQTTQALLASINRVVWQPDETGPDWAKGRAWEPATDLWYWVEDCPQLFAGYLDTGNMQAASVVDLR